MPNSDLLPPCYTAQRNQLGVEAAIMELTLWVEQRGSAKVAGSGCCALLAIDRNEEFIKKDLVARSALIPTALPRGPL